MATMPQLNGNYRPLTHANGQTELTSSVSFSPQQDELGAPQQERESLTSRSRASSWTSQGGSLQSVDEEDVDGWNLYDSSEVRILCDERAWIVAGIVESENVRKDQSFYQDQKDQEYPSESWDMPYCFYTGAFDQENQHGFMLPRNSVVTAGMIMPLIAWSAQRNFNGKWRLPVSLRVLRGKSMFLALCSFAVQFSLLSALWSSQSTLKDLDGIPHLCTYGADPGASSDSRGPWGVQYKRDRSNVESDYSQVVIRNTLFEILKHLNATDRHPSIEPVDFGMESATCRVVCMGVLTLMLCYEFLAFLRTVDLIRRALPHAICGWRQFHPERKSTWITFETDVPKRKGEIGRENGGADFLKDAWQFGGKSAVDLVKFRLRRSMPLHWLLWWCFLAGLRLVVFFWFMCDVVPFMMNSASITELILNSLAFGFVLELDISFWLVFSSCKSKDILTRLQCEGPEERERPDEKEGPSAEDQKTAVKNKVKEISEYEFEGRHQRACSNFCEHWFIVYLCIFLVVTVHYLYFFMNCEMEVAPFSFSDLYNPYFEDDARTIGGWESIFGQWRSSPIKTINDRKWFGLAQALWSKVFGLASDVTCTPYNNGIPPIGCSVPRDWSGWNLSTSD